MKFKLLCQLMLMPVISVAALSACSNDIGSDANSGANVKASTNTESKPSRNISFLAFGDGGYHFDYPKIKHIRNPRNKTEFVAKEKQDWLEDGRPLAEFDHTPLYVYPNTQITTEQGGAKAVGLAITEVCRSKDCQFAIQLGDNIYPDGADADDGKNNKKRMGDLILKPLKPLFKEHENLIVYSALGNHDWNSSRQGVAMQTQWMSEQKNFHLDEQGYYSYRIGELGNDVEFFVLDTNMLLSGQKIYNTPLNPDGSEKILAQSLKSGAVELKVFDQHKLPIQDEDEQQLAWLVNGLESSTAKWKIVYGHHILWSIGGTKYNEGHVLRRLLLPSLCQYADAYIAGHEHDLELLTDDCSKFDHSDKPALPLIISGAASKMRGTHSPFAQQQAKRYPQYELVWAKSFVWGFAHIELDNQQDKLNVEFYTTPRDRSGKAEQVAKFSFAKRSP